ncbi:MAG: hypothetical protein ABW250_19030 [Pyrinomonadaceae bacterium]
MKHFYIAIAFALTVTAYAASSEPRRAGALVAPAAHAAAAQENNGLPERDVINKTFQLDPNARVEVSGIAGSVTVETTGGGTAEVEIVRMAQTPRELRCYETVVRGTSDSLTVRHNQFSNLPGCNSIRSRQQVTLRVPRTVELALSTIGGSVDIGAVDGIVRLSNIAGHVNLAQAQAAEISSLANGLTMSLAQVSDRGVRIHGVVGVIDLSLARDVNAELRLNSVNGGVRSNAPDINLTQSGGSYRARAGAGGALISISGVNGSVRLKRS